MTIEEAKKTLLEFINCAEEEFEKVKFTSTSTNVDDRDIEAINTAISELHAMQNLLDEKNEEIEHLQKENEELKNERNGYRAQVNSAFDNGFIHKDKIREKIEELKHKLKSKDFTHDMYIGTDKHIFWEQLCAKKDVLENLLKEE